MSETKSPEDRDHKQFKQAIEDYRDLCDEAERRDTVPTEPSACPQCQSGMEIQQVCEHCGHREGVAASPQPLREVPEPIWNRVATAIIERCATRAFESVKVILNSEFRYSPDQVAAMVASNVRSLIHARKDNR